MLTRKDYMNDSENLHHEYFSQFVTPQTIAFVESNIGLNRLQASECPHLNDVVRWERGGQTWLWDRSPMNTVKAKECGEGTSLSTRTCVGKAAARMLLEQSANVQ